LVGLKTYTPFKSIGSYADLTEFCDVVGTGTLKSPFFDPAYFKGSTLKFYNPMDDSQTEISPSMKYFEVMADGTIVDQGSTEPVNPITVNGNDCENFTASVFLKYAVNETGKATQAEF
jgi:hypothetical protein